MADRDDFDALLASLPAPTAQPEHPVLEDMAASGGRPGDMTAPQVAQVRAHLEGSFWDFAYSVCGCDILYAPVHRAVCELVERHGTPEWKRLMVQLPRSALKSTLFTRDHALWRVVRNPNDTIAIFNEKVERVEKWLLAIQSIVASSELFHTLWPHVIPPGIAKGDPRSLPKSWKWSAREMLFERDRPGIPESTITAMSVGGASAGGHWQWLLHDDLISVEAQQSRTVMKSVKDWFDTSIYLGPTPETMNAWICCTRWHYDDVYEYAKAQHGFRLYRRSALENGASIWPERWSTKSLLAQQERRPTVFACQMQNTPIAGENTAFIPEKLKHLRLETRNGVEGIYWSDYDPALSILHDDDDTPPRWVSLSSINKTLLVDPAPSVEGERKAEPDARNALVLKGCDAWGRRYWLSVWAGREGPIERAHRILRMLQAWGTHRLAIEEVAAQKEIIPWVRDLARREYDGMAIGYIPLKPGRRDKDSRIAGLAGSVAGGWEGCLDECRPIVLEEMLVYPYGRTRDILDAGAYDRDPGVLGRPESPWEVDDREYLQAAVGIDQGRDPYTGY